MVLQLMAGLLGPLSREEERPLGKPQGTLLVTVTGDQAANLASSFHGPLEMLTTSHHHMAPYWGEVMWEGNQS